MKIVHVIPNAPYNDNWGYQDNLLPKHHKLLGHDVTVIATNLQHSKNGIEEIEPCNYVLDDGVKVIRLRHRSYYSSILTELFTKLDIYELLKEIMPDYIFYHGLVSNTILDVIKYKKRINNNCLIVEDNHLDYNIGSHSVGLKKILGRGYYRFINRIASPYVEKIYGVTPWRKTYAEEYFKCPVEKTDVLIMGADDSAIDFEKRDQIRETIRRNYSFADDDFVIITGGKVDKKKNVLELMEAVYRIADNRIKLLIFGSISDDIKEKFYNLLNLCSNITYIGWIKSNTVYEYYFASDLAFFPGQHSVLWEQACASKIPCVFKKWEGMDHVDCGGNSLLACDLSVEKIISILESLDYTEEYRKMLEVARSEKTNIYLYSNIAQKSLECVKQ